MSKHKQNTNVFSRRTVLLFLSLFLFIYTSPTRANNEYPQLDQVISVKVAQGTVSDVFKQIENQTSYRFLYQSTDVSMNDIVTVNVDAETVEQVMNQVAKQAGLKYTISGNQIHVASVKTATKVLKIDQKKLSVKGQVLDQNGDPLIGVSIFILDSNAGTISDIDGNFTVSVNPNSKLKISYLGYTEKIVSVKDESFLKVVLQEETELLDEVVVVGYGVQKKANLTGSVASIDFNEQAESRPVTNVSTALAGLSAGVSVRQSSGQPGSDGASIKIRGVGSLSGSSEPLVIIDGIQGVLDAVNPQDIANISVLKDAAAGAIYGSQAANGVILITTKSGNKKDGRINVRYSGHISRSTPANLVKSVTNYADYMEFINESFNNYGKDNHFSQSTIDLWREKSLRPNDLNENGVPNYIAYPNTNWQKAIFKNKVLNEHNVSIDGASEKISFLMSAGYLNNPGLVDRTGIEKFNFRTNVEAKVTDWLKVGNRTFASLQNADNGNFGDANNFLRQTTPGLYPEWNGQYGYPEAPEESATANSVLFFLNNRGGKNKQSRVNTTIYTSVTPIEGLSWDFNLNYQRRWDENKSWTNSIEKVRFSDGKIMTPQADPSQMTTSFNNYTNYSYTLENLLRYNKTFRQDHDFGALVGYNEYYYYAENTSGSKKGLIDGSIVTPGSATEMLSIGGGVSERATRSYFGRINYAYKSRYLFEANVRYDGHARFHKDHRWGTFPSFSGAWRISEEKFMESTRSWLDNLKIRASWGKLGSASSGEYEYQSTYKQRNTSFGGKQAPGLAIIDLANERISWETSTTTNLGIDANFLDNRLRLEFDMFNRTISDLLYRPGIYLTLGEKNGPRQNVAKMRNRGYEVTLGWTDHIDEFSYSVTGNFSYVKNKVLKHKGKLNADLSNLGDVSDGGIERLVEGHQLNEYFLKDTYRGSGTYYDKEGNLDVNGGPRDGMIRTEDDMKWLGDMIEAGYEFRPNKEIKKDKIWYGDFIYADANGDGIYGGDSDRQFQGSSKEPKYNFGLQASAAWKGFDFAINFAGASGFKLYWGATSGYNTTATRVGLALPKDIAYNHYFYNPENPSDTRTNIHSKNPRLTAGESGSQNVDTSTRYLFNGSYLKLKNITFGYTIPQKWTRIALIERARVYVSGENLHTFTDYPGQDPELGVYPGYTSVKQVAFGLNITF